MQISEILLKLYGNLEDLNLLASPAISRSHTEVWGNDFGTDAGGLPQEDGNVGFSFFAFRPNTSDTHAYALVDYVGSLVKA